MGQLIDARELARRLNVPVTWVYTAAREGRLPKVQIGKYVRFDPQVIGEAIAEAQKYRNRKLRRIPVKVKTGA